MDIQVNDVVQVVPEHKWGGCFVHVTEIKNWGIQGFVQIPIQGSAYIRLKKEEFEKIGTAIFIPLDEYLDEEEIERFNEWENNNSQY
jgi:hypothetical protein